MCEACLCEKSVVGGGSNVGKIEKVRDDFSDLAVASAEEVSHFVLCVCHERWVVMVV